MALSIKEANSISDKYFNAEILNRQWREENPFMERMQRRKKNWDGVRNAALRGEGLPVGVAVQDTQKGEKGWISAEAPPDDGIHFAYDDVISSAPANPTAEDLLKRVYGN